MDTWARNITSHYSTFIASSIAALLLSAFASSAESANQRPIEDFLSTQGTFCVDDGAGGCFLFVPPDPNFLGWSTMLPPPKLPIVRSRPEVPLFAGVDYAGLANAYALGKEPDITGSITERPLSDGRAEVAVILRTKGANIWVIDLDLSGDVLDQIANKPTLFGHRPDDIVTTGASQALADSLLHIRFINVAPGGPLPDLLQLVNFPDTLPAGMELEFLAFTARAVGPLTEEYTGVPEDTPGRCTITQTGLIPKAGQSRVLADAFPVEDINLFVVGR